MIERISWDANKKSERDIAKKRTLDRKREKERGEGEIRERGRERERERERKKKIQRVCFSEISFYKVKKKNSQDFG